MARTPKKIPPAKPLLGGKAGRSAAEDFNTLARTPTYAGIDRLNTREQIIAGLNERATRQFESTEAVNNLLWIGAVVEKAIALKIIVERSEGASLEGFVTEQTKLTVSYVRMGRRFYKADQDGTMKKALDWYKTEDATRGETGLRFKAQQPTGVILVRDAIKGYREYAKLIDAGTQHEDALDAVDEKFPTDVVREVDEEDLSPKKQRLSLEALLIDCIAHLVTEGTHKGDELARRFSTVQDFLEWSNDHRFTEAEDTYQATMRAKGKIAWHLVNPTVIIPPSARRDDDEGGSSPVAPVAPVEPQQGGGEAAAPETGTDDETDDGASVTVTLPDDPVTDAGTREEGSNPKPTDNDRSQMAQQEEIFSGDGSAPRTQPTSRRRASRRMPSDDTPKE